MIKLIHMLVFGHYCEHEWEIIDQILVYSDYSRDCNPRYPERRDYVLQCKKCGNIKRTSGK
jgi:hypothetical protein